MKRGMTSDVLGLLGSRAGVALLGTLTSIFLARGLGPDKRGLFALVTLLPTTLLTITKLGITPANVYCVRREGASLSGVATNSLFLGMVLGLVVCAATWFLRDALLSTILGGVPGWALLLALWRVPLLLVDNFFWGVLQAKGNFSLYNRRTLAGAALVMVMVVGARFTVGLTLWNASWIYAATTTIVVLSLLYTTRQMIPFGLRPDRALLGRQMSFGLLSYAQILTMHMLFRSDVYIVSYFLGATQAGFYSLALHFTEIVLEIPQAIGWVIYPKMASLDKSDVHALTAQASRGTILLTATSGMVAAIGGPFLIPLWYGADFAAAARPLSYAMLGAVMMSVFTILSRDFTSRNKQAINISSGMVALVSNVLFNILLIPRYGIVGAAIATSMAYTLAAVMLLIAFRRDSGMGFREVLIPRRSDVEFIWAAVRGATEKRLRSTGLVSKATTVTKTVAPQVIRLLPCEESEWDTLLAAFPDASVFHRLAWLQLVATQRRAELKLLRILDGERPAGLLPLFLFRKGVFKIAASPPPQAGTPYLGPMVAPALLPSVMREVVRHLRAQKVSYIEIRFAKEVETGALAEAGFETEQRATFLLDMRPGEEALWRDSLSSSCRRAVRKGQNSGVTIVEGDLLANLDRYWEMAQQVFAKSNRPPWLSKDDYRAIGELAAKGGPVKVFFAYLDDKLISGGIFPYDSRGIYYLDGASDSATQDARPNNLLHWEVIRWACSQGIATYDMVGAGIESVARFKRTFGPTEVPYTYAHRSIGPVTRLARGAYARLAPAGRAMQHAAQRWTGRGGPSAGAAA